MRSFARTDINFSWQIAATTLTRACSLKNDGRFVHPSPQSNAWEPRGNRGRLRHCNGLQTPTATGHEPGRRERGWRPQVRIPVWLCSSWPLVGAVNFSVTEKDEAISRTVFGKESLNAFILHPGGV